MTNPLDRNISFDCRYRTDALDPDEGFLSTPRLAHVVAVPSDICGSVCCLRQDAITSMDSSLTIFEGTDADVLAVFGTIDLRHTP